MNAYLQEERQRCQLLASQLGREQQGSESRAAEVSQAEVGGQVCVIGPVCRLFAHLLSSLQPRLHPTHAFAAPNCFLRCRSLAWRPWHSSPQRR